MWMALALHVTDEALTGFLSIYNPTILALRARFGFWPMPTFEFGEWLTGLILGILLLATLSRFAFRNVRWIRPLFYFLAVVGGGHERARPHDRDRPRSHGQHGAVFASGARVLLLASVADRVDPRVGAVEPNAAPAAIAVITKHQRMGPSSVSGPVVGAPGGRSRSPA
jgi:hypothetical protein